MFLFVTCYADHPDLHLSLHDALPISSGNGAPSYTSNRLTPATRALPPMSCVTLPAGTLASTSSARSRSEEHTSELQSRLHLVCRLLLEKKKKQLDKRNMVRYVRQMRS